jgi:N-acetylglucosamine repressor
MRKINTRNFRLATRSTPRDVNRRIVLNLIREFQPISRAELARRMQVRRGTLTPLVRELVDSGVVFEKGTAATARGRRPTMLAVRTRGRLVIAVDVRSGQSSIALSDVAGRMIARESFETPATPEGLVDQIETHVGRLLRANAPAGATDACQGIGIVLPGMVDRKTGKLIYAPRLGWRDVDLRAAVKQRIGMKVYIESAPIACALARLWLEPEAIRSVNSFAYVSVSEGIGVGIAVNGEMLRGESHTAGEFGHVSLDLSGPECVCGRRGCWEALACNAATVDRYVEEVTGTPAKADARFRRTRKAGTPGIEEVVRRARSGEQAAIDAIVQTGTNIGRGLAVVVSAFNPGRIYVGGEITEAWDILERPMRDALVAGTIPGDAGRTPVVPDSSLAQYRLLGAVALVTAPGYAALAVG